MYHFLYCSSVWHHCMFEVCMIAKNWKGCLNEHCVIYTVMCLLKIALCFMVVLVTALWIDLTRICQLLCLKQ